jgi:saxitoxin biosynthesis operon SxtJ-like protein
MTPQNEKKMIRSFGLFVGLVCVGLGAYLTLRSHQPRYLLFLAGAYFLLGALAFQPMLRPVFLVWMRIAGALGWFNTRLLLGVLFFVLFTPIALIQKLVRRDVLKLTRPVQDSFWTPKLQAAGKNSYFRQF